jgi:TRAP transporter TAXI family solute receptor
MRSLRLPMAILLALLLAACASTGGQPSAKAPFNLTFGTGAAGGVYAVIGAGIAEVINKHNPDIRVAAQAAAGGVENARLVGSKQVHMGFATADVLYNAYHGRREFEKGAFPNLRAMFANYPNVLHFLVPTDSPIKSPRDLKGKTISVGAPGSLPRAVVNYGLKAGTDYKEQYLQTQEGIDATRNRQVDGVFIVLGLPAASVTEAMTSGTVRFVGLEPNVLDQAVKDFPYWSKTVIGKSVYPKMAEDISTLGIPTVLLTHADVPEQVIYQVTKTLLERRDELAKYHAVGKDFTLENATKGISTPYHPGAKKYLQEKGVKVQ